MGERKVPRRSLKPRSRAERADEVRREELADFLRTRRERLTPGDVGLPATARRRVRGLRREEVAELADIGIAWYTALEQGRPVTVSSRTLDRIAAALRLAPEERTHVFLLAGQNPPVPMAGTATVSPALEVVLHSLNPQPAYVVSTCGDILAWNSAAVAVFGDFGALAPEARNVLWLTFVEPGWRTLFVEWEAYARCHMNLFRAEYGGQVGSEGWNARVEALRRASPEFRAWWAQHDVARPDDWRKRLAHPTLGELLFDCVTLHVQGAPTLRLSIFTPAPGTKTWETMTRALGRATPGRGSS